MRIVKQYISAESFETGVNALSKGGWTLDSWHMVPNGSMGGIIIVAVFRGRG